MNQEAARKFPLVLSRGPCGSRITVDLDSYLEFNADIDHDLDELLARWSDFMTVESLNAGEPERRL